MPPSVQISLTYIYIYIYMNDLFSAINKVNLDPLSSGENNYPISTLMYADDLILMSTSHKGLQICLNELQKYCEQ